jgi:chitosanase
MLTDQQKRAAQAIVNVFETGVAKGDYSRAVILPDGAGISYGRSQATDGGGTLDAIVRRYIDRGGPLADKLEPYLDELYANETTKVDPKNPPEWATNLLGLLRQAGGDQTMRQVQDEIFDAAYWSPAAKQGEVAGLRLALSYAVLYDTAIQSGPGVIPRMRNLFVEVPPVRGGDERAWTRAYVAGRRAWLASFVGRTEAASAIVRKTVYRMDAFRELIDAGNWDLKAPFTVRGKVVDESV